MVVLPARRYYLPNGAVGKRLLHRLAEEVRGVVGRWWKSELAPFIPNSGLAEDPG